VPNFQENRSGGAKFPGSITPRSCARPGGNRPGDSRVDYPSAPPPLPPPMWGG